MAKTGKRTELAKLNEEILRRDHRQPNAEEVQELLQEAAKDPEKLTALLVAMGPLQMKKLEKSVEIMEPGEAFTKEDIEDTRRKLHDFTTKVSLKEHEINDELRAEQLRAEIRFERNKRDAIAAFAKDWQRIAELSHKNS